MKNAVLNPIQDRGRGQKDPSPTNFSHVTSTNAGNSPVKLSDF